MAVASLLYWLGNATQTTARVVFRVDANGTVTLVVNGVTYTKAVPSSAQHRVGYIDVVGLDADTSYDYTLSFDTNPTVITDTLRTMPASGTSFAAAYGSCVAVGAGSPFESVPIVSD